MCRCANVQMREGPRSTDDRHVLRHSERVLTYPINQYYQYHKYYEYYLPPVSPGHHFLLRSGETLHQEVSAKQKAAEKQVAQEQVTGKPFYQSIFTVKRKRVGITLHQSCKRDRKSTRLNSSHLVKSYAVFCLKQ